MLNEFITVNRDEIIGRCRAKLASRSVPLATEVEIDHGVPVFLDHLVGGLRGDTLIGGHDLLLQGFTVSQIVHDYGDICRAVAELAMEKNAPIGSDDFRTLNRCLDDAIAQRGSERLGFLAHELRNLMSTALIAFEVLKRGEVGVGGSTGLVLHRSLLSARDLVGRSLAELRLRHGVHNRERLLVSGFIEELAPAATLEANARGVTLTVVPVEDDVAIEADRQVLAAVVGNLLQNAFKFTRPRTTVTLRVGTSAGRVLIEVEDECGGLPGGDDHDELFQPFEQRSADRSGLGLGLAFSRRGVEASHGRIRARTLPDKGCVFTVDLPRG